MSTYTSLLPIGTKVVKRSGKTFKSGLKTNTIAGHGTVVQIGAPGYYFLEDNSIVAASQCYEVPNPQSLFVLFSVHTDDCTYSYESTVAVWKVRPTAEQVLKAVSKYVDDAYGRSGTQVIMTVDQIAHQLKESGDLYIETNHGNENFRLREEKFEED